MKHYRSTSTPIREPRELSWFDERHLLDLGLNKDLVGSRETVLSDGVGDFSTKAITSAKVCDIHA